MTWSVADCVLIVLLVLALIAVACTAPIWILREKWLKDRGR